MKSMILRWSFFFTALFVVTNGHAKLRVVASTSQIADIVRNVGGDEVDLTVLMGPGVDPHLYKATARDVVSMQRADLILYNGLHLEGRLAETFSKVNKLGRTVVAVAESIPAEQLLASANYEDAHDPHVWFDPALWAYVISSVEESLAQADPDHAQDFAQRSSLYKREVESVSAWAQKRIDSVPVEQRVLVTSHDAYNYFGRAFGFQVVGVQGVSTASEAGLADITKTADFIKRRKIPAIFVESSVSPATIERISKDSGARIGGELFSDALGARGEMHIGSEGEQYDVGTYLGMFKYNVDTIVNGLIE
ncbi:metal ABC transporter solute-binding protein, Zn/Mn family [Pelagicoccus sp. SDUM812002]|uniref:metal ABC transporter solute-binding protein, Zn/Mn family n=1 Tax=Pelagicoccus sp. SDUM812002 TaxID=3041266 RepID=UPI00280D4A7E|nr:zinc ABC transporter substrate-binding protein [Pelagicoccus sp. SDUM812002]MDQ8184687.1 zinc ABC transporter substrate-binding protein [Pelagicoccus sp. SDUM812002]